MVVGYEHEAQRAQGVAGGGGAEGADEGARTALGEAVVRRWARDAVSGERGREVALTIHLAGGAGGAPQWQCKAEPSREKQDSVLCAKARLSSV